MYVRKVALFLPELTFRCVTIQRTKRKLSQKRLQLAGEKFHHPYLNHGHLLLTVKVLYTSDIFFKNKEMIGMKGGEWNVQEIVERPSVYILFANADDTR